MKRFNQNNKGFTLVEVIAYVAILLIFVGGMVFFSLDIILGSQKAYVINEVQNNVSFARERILIDIREAETVNIGASTLGSHPGVLQIESTNGAEDPIIYDISGNRLRVQYGANPAQFLTSEFVEVTNLVFTDLSVNNLSQNIQVDLTMQHVNPTGVNEYDWEETIQFSGTVRLPQ